MGGRGGGNGGTTPIGGGAGTQSGPQTCTFQIDGAPSPAIPTVGIVDWSTGFTGLTGARIEFTLNDPAADEINRGSGGPNDIAGTQHRALMLGLKPARTYTYRIVTTDGAKTCTSPDRTLTTGADTNTSKTVLTLKRNAQVATAPAQGFTVTTNYTTASAAYIVDADGDIVWWADAPVQCSRARMDWEGANMWMVAVNGNQGVTGHVRRASMDGTTVLDRIAELDNAHHDSTVLPGGVVATLLWTSETSKASDLVERSPDGTVKTVVRIADNVFPRKTEYHANAVSYRAADDTYLVGDLTANGYVKMTRGGQAIWQFLVGCPSGSTTKCAAGDLLGNHGHHLLDGSLIFIKARMNPSPVFEYRLTETATSLSASQIWSYSPSDDTGTAVLGDVQRLPNGNTLITYSQNGEMREISPTGQVVQTIQTFSETGTRRSFGYADFRPTLYGPPPR